MGMLASHFKLEVKEEKGVSTSFEPDPVETPKWMQIIYCVGSILFGPAALISTLIWF